MELSTLTAISPVDGRYREKAEPLSHYFSEFALMRYRVLVEVEYFIALGALPIAALESLRSLPEEPLRDIYRQFSLGDARRIKDIERVTNHDVKAVEYFVKEELEQLGFGTAREFVHFGLTSQDINNTSVPLSIKEALERVYNPLLDKLIIELTAMASNWKDVPMLARTHGQPASPTRLGKEIMVFAERLKEQRDTLMAVKHAAKFGGATGNFNAHHVAFPNIDWAAFADRFVNETLGLNRSRITTQIEHYDHLAALLDAIKRINTILIDLDRDMWAYVSMDYFKQQIKEGEVGSSAMPHKVNPIDFENSEGNLGLANALLEHLSAKLPVSRLQRDLTDSTVLRNLGVPFAHTLIAMESTRKGLSKLLLNASALEADLNNNYAVVAEAIQTILRREGYPNPYETLKQLTRTNTAISADSLTSFINGLDISESVKNEMRAVTPHTYLGI